jgi:hypothetical protein
MNLIEPEMGQWYVDRKTGRLFEVVSVDDADHTIELQDYDGNLDEIERREWSSLIVESVDPPEDLRGIFDIADSDDEEDGQPGNSEWKSTF